MSKTPHTILGVGVVVWRNERILMSKRVAPGKPGYGLWAMPGGTVEPGETPEQAVEREVTEETALRTVAFTPIPHWHWTDQWAEKPWLTLYYLAVVENDVPQNREPEKHGPWEWFHISELPEPRWEGPWEWLSRNG